MIPPMSLLEVTAERVYGAVLFGGIFLAVAVYLIRKQLRNPQNDPVKVIGLSYASEVLPDKAVVSGEESMLASVGVQAIPTTTAIGSETKSTKSNGSPSRAATAE